MKLIGDIHGNIDRFNTIADLYSNQDIIQLGDFGVGFLPKQILISKMRKNVKFIRGNHDNPSECPSIPGYLGNYGSFEYKGNKIFFISGADSIDKKWRTENIDWWKDEQLSTEEFDNATNYYQNYKPDIVLSHDFPFAIHKVLVAGSICRSPENEGFGPPKGNKTAFELNNMLKIHYPKYWIGGHWHFSMRYRYKDTQFIVLDCMEVLDLDYLV